jgi:hypothetical protein
MQPPDRHPLDDEPLDRLWIAAAEEVGFRVERTTEAYASTDGRGTLTIGAPETLDRDDSVAQLVLHELCHALVEGEENLRRPDWGLDNTSERDLIREHGCLRLQAHLADGPALRALLAPTTVSRAYYDVIPPFPLAGEDEAAALGRQGAALARTLGWAPVLERALAATAALVRERGRFADGAGRHPLGGALGPAGAQCAGCAWLYQGHGGVRCRQWAGPDGNGHRVAAEFPACARREPALDCQACAACCREGFDRVTVGVREAVVWKHPALVVRRQPRFELARAGGRCAALADTDQARFICTIYQDRPSPCRELTPGDRRCLAARRHLGLSAGSHG